MDIVARLGAATLIGSIIGFDREIREKPAGLRTHALVSLGAALLTLTATRLSGNADVDASTVSRVIQGVIAGVGFLGGGAILRTSDESIKGLTTAASIWLVAALGIACGAGQWAIAVVSLVLALMVLLLGTVLERKLRKKLGRTRREDELVKP